MTGDVVWAQIEPGLENTPGQSFTSVLGRLSLPPHSTLSSVSLGTTPVSFSAHLCDLQQKLASGGDQEDLMNKPCEVCVRRTRSARSVAVIL